MAVLGAGWIVVAGVAGKEDCSATVGSIDTGDGLYRPCELVGFQQGVVLVALASLVATVLARDARLRTILALAGSLLILVIAAVGLQGLAV